MALTDNCDLFGSVHEDGVNLIARHIMRQRPSLFNFATADIATNKRLWCQIPEFTVDVTKFGNLNFTILPYLPVLGADSPPVGLGFSVQLVRAQIDFHPSNLIALPPELGSELNEQQLAIQLRICGGIRCPAPDALDQLPVTPPNDQQGPPPLVPLPGRMNCFCLDVFAVGHIEPEEFPDGVRLVFKVDGIEIVDIRPEGLEASIECYVRTAVSLVLRQKLAIPLETYFLKLSLFDLSTLSLGLTPSSEVPNNPAIEENQLKVFVDIS